ncbi:MAG: FecR domain-containing protein [Eubacterium sp.]|nr:FecR domain-containing protein [Eubacterium sp.]
MNKKKVVIAISGIILVAIVVALVLFLTVFKKDAYRILKVFEYSGKGNITRKDIGDIEPYSNMVLESGDTVSLDEGAMVLLADEDKYIHLEEGTELVLNATGKSDSSKTTIELKSGAITNDIQNKLSEDSYYEVNTPNSTMSVRGTIFRVEVYEENGIKYTRVSVFEGKVASRLIYKNGDVADKEVTIEKGKEVLIYEDDTTVDYVSPPKDIDYSDLPDSVKELLEKAIEDGRDLDITKEELEKYLSSVVTVTFTYNGKVFGTQTVTRGDKATEPTLAPAATGSWNWDFSKPVNSDTTIEWK